MGAVDALDLLVVSRVLDGKVLKGFCCVDVVYGQFKFVPLSGVTKLALSGRVRFLNAEYSVEYNTLVGTQGSLTDYPSLDKKYVVMDKQGITISHIILASDDNKPIGAVCFNGNGVRNNLLFDSINTLVKMGQINCNFEMRFKDGVGVMPVPKAGNAFQTVVMSKPKKLLGMYATDEEKAEIDKNRSLKIEKGVGDSMPSIEVVNINAVTASEFAKSGQEKLVQAMMTMKAISPYYYAIFSVLKRVLVDESITMGVTESTLYIDLGFLSRLRVPEIAFILLHETLHVVMLCSVRAGKRKHKLWNVANDLYVNEILCRDFGIKELGVDKEIEVNGKKYYLCAEPRGCYLSKIDETIDLRNDSPETLYNRLYKENSNKDSGNKNSKSGDKSSGNNNSGNEDDQSGISKEQKEAIEKAIEDIRKGVYQGRKGVKNKNEEALNDARDRLEKGIDDLNKATGDDNQGQDNSQSNGQSGQQSGSQGQDGQQSGSQGQDGQQSGSQGQDGQQSGSQGQDGSQGQSGQQSGQQSGSQGQDGSQSGDEQSSSGDGDTSLDDLLNEGMSNVSNGIDNGKSKQISKGLSQIESVLDSLEDILNSDMKSVPDDENGGADSSGVDDFGDGENSKSGNNGSGGGESGDGSGEDTVIYNGKKLDVSGVNDVYSDVKGSSPEAKQERLDSARKTLQAMDVKIKMEKEAKGEDLVKNAGAGAGLVQRYIDFGVSVGVDWKVILRKVCKSKHKKTFNLMSPDPNYMSRGMTIASRQAIGKPTKVSGIKFALDVSGSVSESELKTYLSEIANIFNFFDIDGELIYWSTEVGDAGDFSSLKDMLRVKPRSTGGTDVRCVFEYLNGEVAVDGIKEKDKIRDMEVIFIITDGCFNHNYKDYATKFGKKVIWLITGSALNFEPLFGRVIQMDIMV